MFLIFEQVLLQVLNLIDIWLVAFVQTFVHTHKLGGLNSKIFLLILPNYTGNAKKLWDKIKNKITMTEIALSPILLMS